SPYPRPSMDRAPLQPSRQGAGGIVIPSGGLRRLQTVVEGSLLDCSATSDAIGRALPHVLHKNRARSFLAESIPPAFLSSRLARPHHQICRTRQPHALNIPKPRLAQPPAILVLAVSVPLACSHQHIQRKQGCLLWRCLVGFQNEIADDHAPLRRQRSIAASQQIAISLRPKHVANRGNQNHIESLAEKICAK